jgi:hypothetical protein
MLSKMEDHRRNAWYILGGVPLTAGAALAVGWLVAVQNDTAATRPPFWGTASYTAVVLIVFGATAIGLIMTESWPFSFRKFQHGDSSTVRRVDGYLPEEEPLLAKPPGWTITTKASSDAVVKHDGDTVPHPPASRESGRRARNLSDVFKNPEFAHDSASDGSEIAVDLSALQPIRRPAPDFSPEIRRFREIDRDFDGSVELIAAVDRWISDVYDKLER